MSSSSSSSPEITPAMGPDIRPDFSYKNATHDEVLEDLSSRFILNLPDEETASLERISFQVEQAHWFYEDFIREQNTKLPSLPLKKFSAMLFNACPLLQHWSDDHEQAFNTFMQYKTRVPVCGAIMLNSTWEKCVLVKGWKASSGWGFPKGKINESEPQATCAIREVLEETGYNLAGQVNPEHVLEMTIKEQRIAMFIVPNVPEDYPFKTKTRKEISKIEWFRLSDLPTWKRNHASPGKFYLISPFIGPLKAWIASHKPPNASRKSKYKASSHFTATPIPEADEQFQDGSQESSSQTSSADNGGPPTPSPQSTEASHIVHPDMNAMDPQLARLLASLTKTTAISPDPKEPSQVNYSVPNTPTPETSPEAAEAQPSVEIQTQIKTPSTVRINSQSSLPPTHSRTNPQASALTPPTSIRTRPSHSSMTTASERSDSAVPHFANTTATISSRPPTSRRSSSIADISPYLKKQIPTQPTANHLKQLALLEGIANESARMTPRLEAEERRLSTSNQPFNGYSFPPPDQRDHSLLYSSTMAGRQSVAELTRPLPLPLNSYHDPFQVRPRTSLAVHRPMGVGYNTGSMNSIQMTQMLNGHPSQASMGFGALGPPPPPPHYSGMNGYLPYPAMHAPQPAAAAMSGFGAPPYAPAMHAPTNPPTSNVNHLLSILNVKGSGSAPSNAS
ncbi:DCP2-domain-containing protein [Hymenopellis radicata]|nr:DCP2-domain-containing protein [Hymenopellis radicata]